VITSTGHGQELGRLVFGKAVRGQTTGQDRYGRTLGRVLVGDTDVNVHLVRQGLAWWYRKYSDDPKLTAAEDAARRARRGLCADPEPVPPWDWRRREQARKRSHRICTCPQIATKMNLVK